jgi:hypothetical protein
MALESIQLRRSFAVSSVPTTLPVDYYIKAEDINVYDAGAKEFLTQGVHYTLPDTGVPDGANISLTSKLSEGPTRILVLNIPDFTQESVFPRNDRFPSETNERALDKLTVLCQYLQEVSERTIRIPPTDDTLFTTELDASRNGFVLGFGDDGAVVLQLRSADLSNMLLNGAATNFPSRLTYTVDTTEGPDEGGSLDNLRSLQKGALNITERIPIQVSTRGQVLEGDNPDGVGENFALFYGKKFGNFRILFAAAPSGFPTPTEGVIRCIDTPWTDAPLIHPVAIQFNSEDADEGIVNSLGLEVDTTYYLKRREQLGVEGMGGLYLVDSIEKGVDDRFLFPNVGNPPFADPPLPIETVAEAYVDDGSRVLKAHASWDSVTGADDAFWVATSRVGQRSSVNVESIVDEADGGSAINAVELTPRDLGFGNAAAITNYLNNVGPITVNAGSYYGDDGGGGGLFNLVNDVNLVANGGTIFEASGIGSGWRFVRVESDSLTLSDFGCRAGPQSSAVRLANRSRWIAACRTGKTVHVDGAYELERTEDMTIDNTSVKMIGVTQDAELFLYSSGSFVNFATTDGSFDCQHMAIRAPLGYDGVAPVFFYLEVGKYGDIIFDHLKNSGRLRLVDNGFSSDDNPANIGCVKASYSHNRADSISRSFFRFTNVPHDLFDFADNKIRNFDFSFLQDAVTNGGTFSDAHVAAKRLLNIVDNDVRCSDDFYGLENPSGSYYAVVVAQGVRAVCRRNHTEGMKTNNVIALYDFYLSHGDVVGDSITWKNNMCFAPGKGNAVLMKGKGGGSIPELDGAKSRLYTNSSYIIEKKWIERIEKTDEHAWVQMSDIDNDESTEDWICQGIVIDVPAIAFFTSSEGFKNFRLKGITIKADRLQWVSSGTLSLVDTMRPESFFDMAKSLGEISDVNIFIANDEGGPVLSVINGNPIQSGFEDQIYDTLEVSNSSFTGPLGTFSILNEARGKRITIKNVSAFNVRSNFGTSCLGSVADGCEELVIRNTSLISKEGHCNWMRGVCYLGADRIIDLEYDSNAVGSGLSNASIEAYGTHNAIELSTKTDDPRWVRLMHQIEAIGPEIFTATLNPLYWKANTSSGNYTVSSVNTGENSIALTSHDLQVGDIVRPESTGDIPGGLQALRYYIVSSVDGASIQLTDEFGGSPIDITDSGSGTITLVREVRAFLVHKDTSTNKRVAPILFNEDDPGDFDNFHNTQILFSDGSRSDLQFRIMNRGDDPRIRVRYFPDGRYKIKLRFLSQHVTYPGA